MENTRVSVFGLGYVGSVTAACLAGRGNTVIGCDVAEPKVSRVNEGLAPISEPGLDELLTEQRNAGRVRATICAEEAIRESDLSIICVGTPSSFSGALDLRYVESVTSEIIAAIQAKGRAHSVVYRSTMLPGSTRQFADRIQSELNHQVGVYFYPEFLRQGSALADFRNPSLSAIGVLEPDGNADGISSILESDTEVMSAESAELLKYACNAFHATKVAFANEIGRVGKKLGIDSGVVMSALCQDDRLNISSYYLRPGTPFGGSCLPKDVRALCQYARDEGVALPLIGSLMSSNSEHLASVFTCIEKAEQSEILLLGLAFKPGTDDLRGSAMLDLTVKLLEKGVSVKIYDPDVSPRNLIGANQLLAEAKLPDLGSILVSDPANELENGAKVVVVSKACVDVDVIAPYVSEGSTHHVIDIHGWKELAAVACSYEGVCW